MCIESWRLGLGSFNSPGSGFLPFGAAVVMGLLVPVVFLRERGSQRVSGELPLMRGKKIENVICVLCAIFAYPLLLSRMGFLLCTFLFVFFCTRFVGRIKWKKVIMISFATAIVSYVLFDVWLDIRIPRGVWVKQLFP